MFSHCLLVSFLVLQSSRWGREIAACFTLIFLSMSFHCKCPVSLPHCAVGWSAVCDCDISLSYTFSCDFCSVHF